MPNDVFISHAREDRSVAVAIRRLLERNGITCWIDTRDIPGARLWPAAIVEGIRGSRALLLILSRKANESPQVARELERAADANLPILVVRKKNIEPSPEIAYFVGNRQWLDAFPGPLAFYAQKIVKNVSALLDRPEKPQQPAVRFWLRDNRTALYAGGIATAALLFWWMPWPCWRDYRIRVALVDTDGRAVDATPNVPPPGEAKKLPGGWEIRVPRAGRPANGRLVITASSPGGRLKGASEVRLGRDCASIASIQLLPASASTVRGRVLDRASTPIAGARVSLENHDDEAVVTGANGDFELNAHAPPGTYLLLHIEKSGFSAVDQNHFAGPDPMTVILEK